MTLVSFQGPSFMLGSSRQLRSNSDCLLSKRGLIARGQLRWLNQHLSQVDVFLVACFQSSLYVSIKTSFSVLRLFKWSLNLWV